MTRRRAAAPPLRPNFKFTESTRRWPPGRLSLGSRAERRDSPADLQFKPQARNTQRFIGWPGTQPNLDCPCGQCPARYGPWDAGDKYPT
jgi:hypothetical protein